MRTVIEAKWVYSVLTALGATICKKGEHWEVTTNNLTQQDFISLLCYRLDDYYCYVQIECNFFILSHAFGIDKA